MRWLFGILVLVFCSVLGLHAQQLPFQGRLLENGTPVSGTRNFSFSINSGNISWGETHTNVSVTHGLYALVLGQNNSLPADLFNLQNSLPMNIQVNGQAIGTVTLYAPLESDPTVDASVKDGVDWTEIQNKPSLDVSSSNELQQLEIDGNLLSISNGNTITLPNQISGEILRVGSVETVTAIALEQAVVDGSSTRNFIWQSFSLTENAKLKSVELNFANTTNVDIRFRIYPGEGTSGQFLYSTDFPAANYGPTAELQSLSIDPQTTLDLEAGNLYTFYVQGIGDDLFFRRSETNPYLFGTSNINITTDVVFRIVVETVEGYTLEVTPEQMTVAPNLVVQERIKDKTGFVMPVGAIIPYGGASPPEGWLLCDGSTIRRDLYAELFAAIGTNWGAGDGSNTFNLPDMRGRFLRGVDTGAGNDPDAAGRTALYGGNSGDNVGTYQEDAFQGHYHKIYTTSSHAPYNANAFTGGTSARVSYRDFANWDPDVNYNAREIYTDGTNGSPRLSAESRSKNAGVNYIIKY